METGTAELASEAGFLELSETVMSRLELLERDSPLESTTVLRERGREIASSRCQLGVDIELRQQEFLSEEVQQVVQLVELLRQ